MDVPCMGATGMLSWNMGAALTSFWVLMSPPAWMMVWAMSRQLYQAARCSAVSLRKMNRREGTKINRGSVADE